MYSRIERPRTRTRESSAITRSASASKPMATRRGWGRRHCELQNDPASGGDYYSQHDWVFHEFGRSCAKSRRDPEYANGTQNKACSKYKRKIKYAGHKIHHDDGHSEKSASLAGRRGDHLREGAQITERPLLRFAPCRRQKSSEQRSPNRAQGFPERPRNALG